MLHWVRQKPGNIKLLVRRFLPTEADETLRQRPAMNINPGGVNGLVRNRKVVTVCKYSRMMVVIMAIIVVVSAMLACDLSGDGYSVNTYKPKATTACELDELPVDW